MPYTLKYEENLNPEIKSWLSFAVEKLDEIKIITKLANGEKLNEAEAKFTKRTKMLLKLAQLQSSSTLKVFKNVSKI